MQILVSCGTSSGTSSGTTVLTFICSFVLAVGAKELSTVPWTRAPSSHGLSHLLVHCSLASSVQKRTPNFNDSVQFLYCSLALLGLLLQHRSVPDPLVIHHPDRHISLHEHYSAATETEYTSLCSCGCTVRVSRCPSDQVCMTMQRQG